MSSKAYNNVEVSSEEISGLFEETQTTESVPEEPVAPPADSTSVDSATEVISETQPQEATPDSVDEGATESPVVASEIVVIDGEQYSIDDVQGWMKDSNNKADWQKTNTEKSQQLSRWNKLHEKLNEDGEFRDHIKSFFYDDESQIQKLGLDSEFEVVKTPESDEEADKSPLEERLDMLESIESERIMEARVKSLDGQLTKLESEYPEYLGEIKSEKFLTYAEKHAERFVEDGIPNLGKAFREWSYDAMQKDLVHLKKLQDNKVRNDDLVIGNPKVGIKETKVPKQYSNYKEITLADEDISKYFDN